MWRWLAWALLGAITRASIGNCSRRAACGWWGWSIPDTARADAVAREFGCRAFGSVEQMLTTHSEVQAASVAVPTVLHLEVARDSDGSWG